MGAPKKGAQAPTEQSTALANVDISSNTEVGNLLQTVQTQPGALADWTNESSNNLAWPEKELVVCFLDEIVELPDTNKEGLNYEAVSFRVVKDGQPVTSFTNADAMFVRTAKSMKEKGKLPGLCSVYWTGEVRQPDPKRNGYKVLDIRAPKA